MIYLKDPVKYIIPIRFPEEAIMCGIRSRPGSLFGLFASIAVAAVAHLEGEAVAFAAVALGFDGGDARPGVAFDDSDDGIKRTGQCGRPA